MIPRIKSEGMLFGKPLHTFPDHAVGFWLRLRLPALRLYLIIVIDHIKFPQPISTAAIGLSAQELTAAPGLSFWRGSVRS
jgi:hypothetical protein